MHSRCVPVARSTRSVPREHLLSFKRIALEASSQHINSFSLWFLNLEKRGRHPSFIQARFSFVLKWSRLGQAKRRGQEGSESKACTADSLSVSFMAFPAFLLS